MMMMMVPSTLHLDVITVVVFLITQPREESICFVFIILHLLNGRSRLCKPIYQTILSYN